MGIAVLNYLDDSLITASTKPELERIIKIIVDDCEKLQLRLSFEKSILVPVQRLVWCGWLLDFSTGLVHIENKKADKILQLIATIREEHALNLHIPLRRLAKVLGKLVAASRAIQPARLMTRECFRAAASTDEEGVGRRGRVVTGSGRGDGVLGQQLAALVRGRAADVPADTADGVGAAR